MENNLKVKLKEVGAADFFHVLVDTPELFHPLFDLAKTIFNPIHFDLRQRELIILRIAGLRQSSYELFHHNTLGWQAGFKQHEIDQIVNGDFLVEEKDNILLRCVDSLIKNKKFERNEFFEYYNREQLEYITAYIGFYTWLDVYTKSMGLAVGQRIWKK